MEDLREKITIKKQTVSLMEIENNRGQRQLSTASSSQVIGSGQKKRKQSFLSLNGREDKFKEDDPWNQRDGFETPAPVQVERDRDRSWERFTDKRSKFSSNKFSSSGDGRDSVGCFISRKYEHTPSTTYGYRRVDSKATPWFGSSSSRHGFSQKLRFPSTSSDIDIRNDREYDFQNSVKNCEVIGNTETEFGEKMVTFKGSEQIDMEGCEKTYQMAKEIKHLQENLRSVNNENQILRRNFEDADNKVVDVKNQLNVKEDVIKHVDDELLCSRRKIETDEVLIKDLVFENKNKRGYINGLEKEIQELKKTKSKLLDENTQIRLLAKEISDDSDNLLKVINELKTEKKIADEKIDSLLESQKDKEEKMNNEDSKNDNVAQEEVNETSGNGEPKST
eukprot:GFUD01040912.1.p1 GENE.GFUD01040912.1~~GFUD01040912.1.p1  ORF type:complete len:393 (-),score=130.52 GFUD01040912.1:106-1284(-)